MTSGIAATIQPQPATGWSEVSRETIAEKPGMATANGQRKSLARRVSRTIGLWPTEPMGGYNISIFG
jgi:hypothetical protein